jgi:hypothetical protein
MVPLAGIEPATSGSTIRRSNHLSYNGTLPERIETETHPPALSFGDASLRAYGF